MVLALAPAAHARDAVVESFDGTPIVTHFFPAPGLAAGERAPTIMIGHGWGGSGSESPPDHYAEAYNVLTWDARGFGGSGGTVMIDHPEFEGRDAQALIDFVAEQPEAQLDGPGDPRLGMDGGSYGGAIQFVTAARDPCRGRRPRPDRLRPRPRQGDRQPRQGPLAPLREGSQALDPQPLGDLGRMATTISQSPGGAPSVGG